MKLCRNKTRLKLDKNRRIKSDEIFMLNFFSVELELFTQKKKKHFFRKRNLKFFQEICFNLLFFLLKY